MSALHLWQLSAQYSSLMQLMESEDLAPEAIMDTIEAIEGELEEKLVACGHVVMNLESAAMVIADVAAKQMARSQRLAKRAESLRAYMLFHAQCVNMKPIEHADFVLKVANNPPSVIIDDPALVPPEYKRTPEPEPPPQPVPDKAKLAAALKQDIEVPGAHLFRGQRLDISI